ncbi:MAG: DUF1232 domain-containing protein [Polyangiaceae bacterium]|nr:DUF1232 domain-containing protein [Polyangiaceae bacterium]
MEDTLTEDLDERCLDAFPRWLRSLARDVGALAGLVDAEELPTEARVLVAGALTYLVKSLDLIPDGVEDLGYIDDAFVVRVASALALDQVPEPDREALPVLASLASDARLIERFMGAQYPRLERYAARLSDLSARGRSAQDIVIDSERRAALVSEIQAWQNSYEDPLFERDPRTLIKLSAFLDTKLPA